MINKLEQEYSNNTLVKYLENLEEIDLFSALESLLTEKKVAHRKQISHSVLEEIQYRSIEPNRNNKETLVSCR